MRWDHVVNEAFPGAIRFGELRWRVRSHLRGLSLNDENTLFGNVICRDELNAKSVSDFAGDWGENFNLAGLGGFPSAGLTGFQAYAGHCPKNGTLLLLTGSHVGVSPDGELGRAHRKGLSRLTTACGSLLGFIDKVKADDAYEAELTPLDAEQFLVESELLKHMPAVLEAQNPVLEATERLYDAIERRVVTIFDAIGYAKQVVYVGGILINTPIDEDYFAVRRAVVWNVDHERGEELDWRDALR